MTAPNAASLGKYGDIPVSYYTGVPNISVPIHTLKEGPLSLPISLSYHASGVKVGELASWVGLGWSLNAGGVITRTVQGIPDDVSPYGYYRNGLNVNPSDQTTYRDISTGIKDGEPDMFSFNMNGYSGKFYFDKNKVAHLVPKQDIKITTPLLGDYFEGFTLITPDGTRYIFGKIPGTSTTAHEFSTSTGESNPSITSWYLLRVESQDKKYQINLSYTADVYGYKALASCYFKYIECISGLQGSVSSGAFCSTETGDDANHRWIRTNMQGLRLSKIISKQDSVAFNVTTIRPDVDANTQVGGNSYSLDNISISSGTFCKKFMFTYDIFEDNTQATKTEAKRLKLTQVEEKSCDNTLSVPAYKFTYDGPTVNSKQFLPYRNSKAVDHWGFYNGAENNNNQQVNVPATSVQSDWGPTYTYGSANRETNETYLKYGSLKKIDYPTGGNTQFTYEANRYSLYEPQLSPPSYLLQLKNNPAPYYPENCGNTSTNGTVTFTNQSQITDGKFSLLLDPAYSTSCEFSAYKYILVEARRVSDNFLIGTYSFNLGSSSTPVTLTKALSFIGTFQTGVAYRFTLNTTDGWGRFDLFHQTQSFVWSTKLAGGLRIKEIKTHDGIATANDIVKTYEYPAPEDPNRSSGELFHKPKYGYALTGVLSSLFSIEGHVYSVMFNDQSIVPLHSFQGYHIGYRRVKEIHNGNGFTLYDYAATPDYLGNYSSAYPRPPHQINVYNGEQQKVTQQNQAGYEVAKTEYSPRNATYTSTPGLLIKALPLVACLNGDIIFYTTYYSQTAAYQLLQKVETIDGVATTINYEYDSQNRHLAPTAVSMTNSDGKIYTTRSKYVFDWSTSALRDTMINRNMIGAPVETTTEQNSNVLSGSKTEYSFYDSNGLPTATSTGNHPYPYRYHNYERTWTGGTLQAGAWALQGTIDSYHPNSSITAKAYPKQFTKAGWSPETYEWNRGLITQRIYNNFVWKYRYYNGTRLVSGITNIDGQRDSFEYDKLSRLKKTWSRTGNVITNYTYFYKGVSSTNNYVETISNFTAVSGSTMTQKGVRQYFDGLGRVMQEIKRQHHSIKGPDGAVYGASDVITNMEYDNQGRPIKTTRPYQGYSDGTYYAPPGGTQFTLTQYESSPLNRAISVTPPNGYATSSTYGKNTTTITIPGGISYSANTLLETKVTDPDNRVAYTYKDKKGRVVLLKKTNTANTSPAETYYVYDDKDRLTTVVPPGATLSNAELIFKYEYSGDDLMLKKKIPGAAEINMKYNDRDLLALTQDGNLLAQTKSMGITYDTYGRPLKTGFVTGFPTTPNSFNFVDTLSRTFYDGEGGGITANLNLSTFPQYRGKIRCSKVKVLGSSSTFLHSTLRYDAYGRVLSTKGNNYLDTGNNNADSTTFSYDWMDTKLVDLRMHNPGSGAATGTQNIRHDHRYDHSGRLINYLFKLNADEVHIAEYNYDTYDQMVERNLHANFTAGTWAWMQSVDYTYNNMGWLTKINSNSHTGTALAFPTGSCAPSLPNPGTTSRDYLPETNDLFYLELRYDQLFDNTTGGGNISGITGGTVQKAGNISQMAYRVRGRDRQAYNFSYDHLSRLSTATYYDVNGSNTATNSSRFNESLTYDIRGNISTLQRQGYYSSSCNYGQIDNLSYTYTTSTNRLASISETAPATQKSHGFNPGSGGAGYTYDANGNLISDSYKGISSISYNHLNLPNVITYSNGNNIEIVYDANGGKLRKMVKVGATLQYEQDYLGGLEYRKVGTNGKRLEAVYHDEGRYYNLNVEVSNTVSIRREYSLRDHLGNTRLTFTDRNANGIVDITNNPTTSDILQENHYYPFGANYEGPWLMNDAARDTKYQYNGKEMNDDFGLNWNDYGARWYDAVVGRFTSIDPLADIAYPFTPYHYVSNQPINRIDPAGLTDFSIDNKSGEITQVGKENDSPDRIVKTKDGEVQYNKKGEAKVIIDNIEKGILKNGINFQENNNVIDVGGKNQPTKEGVEDFILKLANYIDKEIGGYYLSEKGKEPISHIYVGRYANNDSQNARSGFNLSVRPDLVGKVDLKVHYHTHLSRYGDLERLRPTSIGPDRGDEGQKERQLKNIPSLKFLIITNPKPFEY